jgi:tol-pal system protein YbgF
MTLPMALAIGSFFFCGTAIALPGVEERSAGNATGATSSPDVAVIVFEQFQQFQAQIEALTGRVEQLEHELKLVREQEKARYVDLDARVAKVEQAIEEAANTAAAKAAQSPAPESAAESTAAAGTSSETDDEQALFDRGLLLVREKKFDEAIGAFEQQLKRFPRGELTPTAMYWLGEMWRVASKPDLPKAGRYFYRVYNEYPKHNRASAAMYLHGLITCQDDPARARSILGKVIAQHPASKDAALAESVLKNQCK